MQLVKKNNNMLWPNREDVGLRTLRVKILMGQ